MSPGNAGLQNRLVNKPNVLPGRRRTQGPKLPRLRRTRRVAVVPGENPEHYPRLVETDNEELSPPTDNQRSVTPYRRFEDGTGNNNGRSHSQQSPIRQSPSTNQQPPIETEKVIKLIRDKKMKLLHAPTASTHLRQVLQLKAGIRKVDMRFRPGLQFHEYTNKELNEWLNDITRGNGFNKLVTKVSNKNKPIDPPAIFADHFSDNHAEDFRTVRIKRLFFDVAMYNYAWRALTIDVCTNREIKTSTISAAIISLCALPQEIRDQTILRTIRCKSAFENRCSAAGVTIEEGVERAFTVRILHKLLISDSVNTNGRNIEACRIFLEMAFPRSDMQTVIAQIRQFVNSRDNSTPVPSSASNRSDDIRMLQQLIQGADHADFFHEASRIQERPTTRGGVQQAGKFLELAPRNIIVARYAVNPTIKGMEEHERKLYTEGLMEGLKSFITQRNDASLNDELKRWFDELIVAHINMLKIQGKDVTEKQKLAAIDATVAGLGSDIVKPTTVATLKAANAALGNNRQSNRLTAEKFTLQLNGFVVYAANPQLYQEQVCVTHQALTPGQTFSAGFQTIGFGLSKFPKIEELMSDARNTPYQVKPGESGEIRGSQRKMRWRYSRFTRRPKYGKGVEMSWRPSNNIAQGMVNHYKDLARAYCMEMAFLCFHEQLWLQLHSREKDLNNLMEVSRVEYKCQNVHIRALYFPLDKHSKTARQKARELMGREDGYTRKIEFKKTDRHQRRAIGETRFCVDVISGKESEGLEEMCTVVDGLLTNSLGLLYTALKRANLTKIQPGDHQAAAESSRKIGAIQKFAARKRSIRDQIMSRRMMQREMRNPATLQSNRPPTRFMVTSAVSRRPPLHPSHVGVDLANEANVENLRRRVGQTLSGPSSETTPRPAAQNNRPSPKSIGSPISAPASEESRSQSNARSSGSPRSIGTPTASPANGQSPSRSSRRSSPRSASEHSPAS